METGSQTGTTYALPRVESLHAAVLLASFAALLLIAAIPAPLPAQTVIAVTITAVLAVFTFLRAEGVLRIFLALVVFYAVARYMVWRATDTLVLSGPLTSSLSILLFLAEFYAFTLLALSLFVNAAPRVRLAAPMPANHKDWPTVDVLVPTYNEPLDLVEATLIAAKRLNYPASRLRVYMLDDGGTQARRESADTALAATARERHEAGKAMCAALGVTYLTRPDNRHAKAGNINAALPKLSGDLVVILDADHVPSPDLLERTVGYFLADPKVFLVQTPHFLINPDPLERNLRTFEAMPSENEMFYRVVQRGLDTWEASFFCGSAAVLRRRHLDLIGGLSGTSITEDAETALELHARGLRSVYVPHPLVAGLNPETVTGFIVQRSRWAQGMTQILLLKNPLFRRGLTLGQRVGYLSSLLFWFFAVARLVFILTPLLFLLGGFNIMEVRLEEILAYGFPHLFGTLLLSTILFRQVRWPLVSEAYETMLAFHGTLALLKVFLNPRAPKFIVTPKAEKLERDILSPIAWPFLLLFVLLIAGEVVGLRHLFVFGIASDLMAVVVFWNTVNLLGLLIVLGALYERRQIRGWPRLPKRIPAEIEIEGEHMPATLVDCSLTGALMKLDRDATVSLREGASGRLRVLSVHYDTTGHLDFKVRRVGDRTVGISYRLDNTEAKTLATGLMYGNSDDWAEFRERRGKVGTTGWRVGKLFLYTFDQVRNLWEGLRDGLTGLIGRWLKRRRRGTNAAAIALLLLVTGQGMPIPSAAAQDEDAAESTGTRAIRLSELRAQAGPIRLVGGQAADAVSFEIPRSVVVTGATLELVADHAAVLDPRSLLTVFLNDRTVGQFPLASSGGRAVHRLELAAEDFRHGTNRLLFNAAMTMGEVCETPNMPQFWAQIDTRDSRLAIDYRAVDGPLTLADLNHLLDPGIVDLDNLFILTGRANPQLNRSVALAVQAIALHQHYKLPEIGHARLAELPPASSDATPGPLGVDLPSGAPAYLVVALRDELEAMAETDFTGAITGPFVHLSRLGEDGPALLVLSGRTHEEIALAAEALAVHDFPWPQRASAIVSAVLAPEEQILPRRIAFGRDYEFGELGFKSVSRRGALPEPITLAFRVPADFFPSKESDVALALDFSYGPGARADSSLSIEVNGDFVMGIPMNVAEGAEVRDYRVRIPVDRLRPGDNEIRFTSLLLPSAGGECLALADAGLAMSLSATSEIRFPAVGRHGRVPDLAAFGIDGFPYLHGRAGAAENLVVALGGDDSDSLAAGWTIMGKMAQLAGHPLDSITLASDRAELDGSQIIAVMAAEDVPLDWATAMPVAFDRTLRLGNVAQALLNGGGSSAPRLSLPASGLGDMGALMQFALEDSERTVTLLTAATPAQLRLRAHDLVQPGIWSQLDGALFTWEAEPESAASFGGLPQRTHSDLSWWHTLERWTGQHPMLFVLATLAVVGLFAFIVWVLLRHLRRRVSDG